MAVRVDKWLWSVRVYKTRSQATEGAKTGRVLVNNETAKPATKLVPGDVVEARLKERTIVYEVLELLEKRVGAAIAAGAYVDNSPVEIKPPYMSDANNGIRGRGEGRPTKRDRREIQKLRGRG